MPPLPKPAGTRQRRHKSTTARTLSVVHDVEAPELPALREWLPSTLGWWAAIWASPMAPEFERQADMGELYKLASLEDDFWRADKPRDRLVIAAEIRLQRQCFGLTPLDRRRLQWEIDRGESADGRVKRRRREAEPAAQSSEDDSRRLLA